MCFQFRAKASKEGGGIEGGSTYHTMLKVVIHLVPSCELAHILSLNKSIFKVWERFSSFNNGARWSINVWQKLENVLNLVALASLSCHPISWRSVCIVRTGFLKMFSCHSQQKSKLCWMIIHHHLWRIRVQSLPFMVVWLRLIWSWEGSQLTATSWAWRSSCPRRCKSRTYLRRLQHSRMSQVIITTAVG